MQIIISGGGTGGHIYPALAIADELMKIKPDLKITFVGTKKGLESDIVTKHGYEIRYITVSGFERRLSLDTITSVKNAFSWFLTPFTFFVARISFLISASFTSSNAVL